MAGGDPGPLEQRPDAGGRGRLPRMRPEGVDLGAERTGRAHERLDAESAGDVGGVGETAGPVEGDHPHGEHPLGAVEQGEPLLRPQPDRLQPRRGERLGGGADHAVHPDRSLTDDREGEMGERGEVPRGADRSQRRHHREDPPVEQLEQPGGDLGTDARVSLGEGPGPQQEHRPHEPSGSGSPTPAAWLRSRFTCSSSASTPLTRVEASAPKPVVIPYATRSSSTVRSTSSRAGAIRSATPGPSSAPAPATTASTCPAERGPPSTTTRSVIQTSVRRIPPRTRARGWRGRRR